MSSKCSKFPAERIGDKGQRYEVSIKYGDGREMIIGWSENDPFAMASSALKFPGAVSVTIFDRQAASEAGT